MVLCAESECLWSYSIFAIFWCVRFFSSFESGCFAALCAVFLAELALFLFAGAFEGFDELVLEASFVANSLYLLV